MDFSSNYHEQIIKLHFSSFFFRIRKGILIRNQTQEGLCMQMSKGKSVYTYIEVSKTEKLRTRSHLKKLSRVSLKQGNLKRTTVV